MGLDLLINLRIFAAHVMPSIAPLSGYGTILRDIASRIRYSRGGETKYLEEKRK